MRPDQSKEKRQCDSLLLPERWDLIQSGVDKKDIKIKSTTVYVKGEKRGQLIDGAFKCSNLHNDCVEAGVSIPISASDSMSSP